MPTIFGNNSSTNLWNVNQNTSSLINQTIPIGWHITSLFKAMRKPTVKIWLEDQMCDWVEGENFIGNKGLVK